MGIFMSKLFFTKSTFVSLSFVLALTSCMEKDLYQGGKNEPLNPTEVFDFSLTKQVKLSVNYGFTNDYYIIFELYDQNPMIEQEDSWIKNEELKPVYTAPTDKKGQYSGTITLPSDITEVWLYSEYLGVVSPVKLTIANGQISFNQNDYIASLQTRTRGITNGGYKYDNVGDIMPGVDWDVYGLPSNIEPTLSMPPADILYSIQDTYNGAKNKFITEVHPEWCNNTNTSEIKIIKDTEISLVFINSGASWNNTVGYFTYPSGTIPTEKTIKRIIAFPNISPISKINNGVRAGAMICGHEVKLKYWDGEQFKDKFPSGVSIGWYLEGNSFNKGNISKQGYAPTRYSYGTMNGEDGRQRVVALRHAESDQLVAIGFEDSEDFNYTDATFYVKVAESGAISADIPSLPPVDPPKNVTSTTIGTLAFEDQWPLQGDYDMNDVIVEYNSTLYKNAVSNKIYKIVDEFTPVHSGGIYTCGFGYQLSNVESSRVTKIEVSGSTSWKVETDQAHPTIILFDNLKSVLEKKITVTIELSDVIESQVTPPYNPFIFVNDRSKEVHLVNYPPTEKANMELFNTEDDVSNVSAGVYYIARYQDDVELMPYCINLPVLNFKYSDESVKIYETYPKFIEWVKSKGQKATDWYKK